MSLASCEANVCVCARNHADGISGREKPAQRFDERWRDRHGDIWREGADGLMHTFETAPFPREHVERKWGPLVLVPDPIQIAHNLNREDC